MRMCGNRRENRKQRGDNGEGELVRVHAHDDLSRLRRRGSRKTVRALASTGRCSPTPNVRAPVVGLASDLPVFVSLGIATRRGALGSGPGLVE